MKIVKIVLFAAVVLLLDSCITDDRTIPNKDMSVLAYIVADNDLDDHAAYAENDLISGLKECPTGTELIIYMDRLNQSPTLKKYTLTDNGKVGINKIKEYPEQCSTSPSVFGSVLSDMRTHVSGKRYGLVYWSHGSGWLPAENDVRNATRAIGMDCGVSMDIVDMAESIERVGVAAFTVLDACFMGCAPVAYELRNVTDYLIVSPASLPGTGFCYNKMLPDLLECTEQSLSRSLDIFAELNETNLYGDSASFAIASVIKCDKIDNLACSMHDVLLCSKGTVNAIGIQSFDFDNPHLYYDLEEYVDSIAIDRSSLSDFREQLKDVVVKAVSTSKIWSMNRSGLISKPVKNFCGLSTFIPGSANAYYNRAFTRTSWYSRVYE